MSPELESKQIVDRTQIARFFQQLAEGMDGSGPIRVSMGDTTIKMDPPERLEFDVEVEDESKRFRRGERSLEIELSWKRTSGDRPIGE